MGSKETFGRRRWSPSRLPRPTRSRDPLEMINQEGDSSVTSLPKLCNSPFRPYASKNSKVNCRLVHVGLYLLFDYGPPFIFDQQAFHQGIVGKRFILKGFFDSFSE